MSLLQLPANVGSNDRHNIAIIQVGLRALGFLDRSEFRYGEFNSIVAEAIGNFRVSKGLSRSNTMDSVFTSAFNEAIEDARIRTRSHNGNNEHAGQPNLDDIITRLQIIRDSLGSGGQNLAHKIEHFGDDLVERADGIFDGLKDLAIVEAEKLVKPRRRH